MTPDVYELLNQWSQHTAPDYVDRLRSLHVFDGVLEAQGVAWRIATTINDTGLDSRAASGLRQMAANVACGSDRYQWRNAAAASNALAAAADALTQP